MPTYEYRCPDGHEFEKFVQKMSDAQSELACPVCGVVAARRMSAGGGLLFKGSGFYITDYGKDGKKDQRAASAAAESGAKSEAAPKGDGASANIGGAAPASPAAPAPAAAPASQAAPKKSEPKSPPSPSSKPKSGPEK